MSRKLEQLRSRIAAATSLASANGMGKAASAPTAPGVPEKDPNEKPAPEATVDPNAQPGARNEPDANKNTDQKGFNNDGILNFNPVPVTSETTPATIDGNAKDRAATSPTSPLDKIASLAERIRAVKNPQAAAEAAKAEAVKKAAAEATSAAATIDTSTDEGVQQLYKIASTYERAFAALTATEESAALVEQMLRKQAGIAAADEMLREHAEHAEYLDQIYAMEMEMAKQAAAEEEEAYQRDAAFQEFWKRASVEERETLIKIASVHHIALQEQETELEKLAYAQGAEDAALLAEDPEAVLPGSEGVDEAPPSIDELLQMVQLLVESGEMSEEDAAVFAQTIASEMGDGEGLPPEIEEEVKQASVLFDELEG